MSDFDKHLQSNETTLSGKSLLLDGKVVSDITSERIDWLVQHHLQKVATSTSGWETLYRDPNDGRYWERTYPQSETHGGVHQDLTLLPWTTLKRNTGLGSGQS
jgi:hypothetical protein